MALSEPSKSLAPITANQIQRGDYVLVTGFPCKIVDVRFAKTGKHGGRKAAIVGIDLVTKRKHVWCGPGTAHLTSFVPERAEYVAVDADEKDACAFYLDEHNEMRRVAIASVTAKKLRNTLQHTDAVLKLKVLRVPLKGSGSNVSTLEVVEGLQAEDK
jgi:translation elongation factor P/translation initiation factor 5A